MKLDINKLQNTLEISVRTSKTLLGSDDPNFKRIHHHNHHIVLYIKDYIMKDNCKNYFEIGTHFGHSLCNIKNEFKNGIDLLFIDGDHRRKAVISDFNMYFPMVNSGGYIIFDDYLPYVWSGKKRECPIAVNELVDKYKDQLDVIGLVDDLVDCNRIKGLNETKNCDFIIVKR